MSVRTSKRTTKAENEKTKTAVKAPQLSIIVPAYNEVDNIRPLCERLFKALKAEGIHGELLGACCLSFGFACAAPPRPLSRFVAAHDCCYCPRLCARDGYV